METEEDGWVTGPAFETVVALNGIRPGDWVRHAPNCADINILQAYVGCADRVKKVYAAAPQAPRKIDIFTTEGWHTDEHYIDGWKPGGSNDDGREADSTA